LAIGTVPAARPGGLPADRGGRPAGIGQERWMLLLAALYVGLFCVAPLARLVAELFADGPAQAWGVTAELLSNRFARRAVVNTLEAGLAATAVSVILGGLFALAVGLTDMRRKGLVTFLVIMPLLIPAQISALAWLELVGPTSFLWSLPGLDYPAGMRNPLYGRDGVILLMGVEHSPMVFLALRAGLRGMPGDLVEAARAAGAPPLRVVATVILPLLRPALLAGAALAFVSAIGNFGVPALLGIPGRYTMLTTFIYQRLNGFGPSVLGEVAVLATILAVFAVIGVALQAWASSGRRVTLERGGRPVDPFELGGRRLPLEIAIGALLVLIAILPLLALVNSAIAQALGVPVTPETWTLRHFAYALDNPSTVRAFVNSTMLALGAAVVCTLISLPIAYLSIVRRRPAARWIAAVSDAPYVLPGIVLAIACILLYLRPLPLIGESLYNSFWILLIAYLGRFMALTLRPTMSGVDQIDPQLEEAARLAGAGSWRRLAGIVLPMAAPAAAAGGMLVFMAAFNELTVSALLWSAGNETLGVVIFALYDEGNSNAASAVSAMTVLVTLAIAALATATARWFALPRGVLPWQN
jgi:iron(III) transport system permease protein